MIIVIKRTGNIQHKYSLKITVHKYYVNNVNIITM